jgi:hypothetical protein
MRFRVRKCIYTIAEGSAPEYLYIQNIEDGFLIFGTSFKYQVNLKSSLKASSATRRKTRSSYTMSQYCGRSLELTAKNDFILTKSCVCHLESLSLHEPLLTWY